VLPPAGPAPTGHRSAAYFDLDKTILATSSTWALGTPMRRSGLISSRALAYGLIAQIPYLLVGAGTQRSSTLMEHLALMSAGISRRDLMEVVEGALTTAIEPAVYAEALDLIEGHRRAGHDAAEAIMTTDTVPKSASREGSVGEKHTVRATGIAKGSGMIHPNMATMLAFITCDANISSATLQAALSQHVETTFNQITVDGDTSTNDMVLVMANGCQQNEEILPDTEEFEKFSKMLRYLMADLAKKIAKDGEGATKLIEVNVRHAKDEQSGRMIAKSVVGSSLVKTAIFGQDPNWGRILAAIGYAGADVSVDNIDIWIEGIPVMQASSPVAFDPEETSDAMAGELLTLTIDLHDGDVEAQAWGCDLSYDYVKINALYRT